MVCTSSINKITSLEFLTSSIAFLILSSKSPRYFVPATIDVKSSATIFLPASSSGTSSLTILRASPSAMAVLPTPGSPIRQGLFFVRLERICITLSISLSLPITGSIFPCPAASVKSFPNSSRVGVVLFPLLAVRVFPLKSSSVLPSEEHTSSSSDCSSTAQALRNLTAYESPSRRSASRICSVPTKELSIPRAI